jgi:hypothetical protein
MAVYDLALQASALGTDASRAQRDNSNQPHRGRQRYACALVSEGLSENKVSPQQSSFQQLVDENRRFQQKIEELQAAMAQLTTSGGKTDRPASAAVSQPTWQTQGEREKTFYCEGYLSPLHTTRTLGSRMPIGSVTTNRYVV